MSRNEFQQSISFFGNHLLTELYVTGKNILLLTVGEFRKLLIRDFETELRKDKQYGEKVEEGK